MTASIRDAARPFSGHALTSLLSPATRLLGLGEPTHGVEAFLEVRNELFRHLVEHEGYRSIAIESDCLAGLLVEAYVTDGIGTLDDAVAHGFSHGFGASPANRELLRWIHGFNQHWPREEQLTFYGFDGPLEITGAASPRPSLIALHDYVAAHLDPPCDRATLDALLGDDARWTDEAIMYDPAKSIGRTPEARELRLLADDLSSLLTARAPGLTAAGSPDAFWRAELHARTAIGLLRYHAAMAETGPERIAALLSRRAAMMADNLAGILRREERRGPTLVHAHNAHLQREESSMRFGGRVTRWWSAGAITGARLGDRYAYAATTFGSRGCDVPPADTLEGLLSTLPHDRSVLDPAQLSDLAPQLTPRTPADHTYAALDPATAGRADAIVFVRDLR